MDQFINVKVIPYAGREDEFVCLRWDAIYTTDSFVFSHYDSYTQAKSVLQGANYIYPVNKMDYKPVMTHEEWNNLQSKYMREEK